MPLITNVAYSPDPTDGQALGLDVAVDGATRLVVSWGDGSPLQVYQVEPGSNSIHLSHAYAGPAAGTIAIRAAAPGVPDERTTLNVFVGADEAYTRVSGDPEEPEITRKGPLISADGQWVAWADAYNEIYSGYGVTLKNLVDGTTVSLGSTHGDAYQFDGGPVMLANGKAAWFAERYSGIEGYEFHPVVLYRTEAGDWTTLRDAYDVTVTDDAKYAVYRQDSTLASDNGWYLRDLDTGTNTYLGSSSPEYDGPRYHVHVVDGQLTVDDDTTGQRSVSGPLATDTTADGSVTVVATDDALTPGDTNNGSDVYLQENGAPTHDGTAGPDALLLGAANDIADGGAGKDYLAGGLGDDSLSGGAGDDLLEGGAGADSLDGGEGIDAAGYATSLAGVQASLDRPAGNTGDAAGDSYAGVENLLGSAFADRLEGDAAANALRGGAGDDRLGGLGGDDRLVGGDGADVIAGGSGSDRIYGGAGDDRIAGGAGPDTIVVQPGFGRDVVTDFDGAGGDVILFDRDVFAGFAEVVAHAADYGADGTVITLDAGNKLILLGVDRAALQANDFAFV
ncbi:calcium-binding protein [Inquilinus sp. Marseille-Q2685]|uniref:calcium-binding protein n=1 Tax=Inquilinus sp. Marseille-Q2685 TaxID=2866581 RepID=UPI00272C1912|nr:calcium-binding protein [Inquilinus sp. Marseille-Q2685]